MPNPLGSGLRIAIPVHSEEKDALDGIDPARLPREFPKGPVKNPPDAKAVVPLGCQEPVRVPVGRVTEDNDPPGVLRNADLSPQIILCGLCECRVFTLGNIHLPYN